jgi:hypothetical protein
MIKTMRIAAIVLAVLAVAALVVAVMLGIRPDPEKEKILKQPSIIEQLKKSAQTAPPKSKETPLVLAAKGFKTRIDPPPKPKPVDPNNPVAGGSLANKVAPPPPPPPQFEVVATCVNPNDPSQSFALLSQPGRGFFWVKPGDEVSRAKVKAIVSGKMVTADGREYKVAVTQRLNLLKPGSQMPDGYAANRVSAAATPAAPEMTERAKMAARANAKAAAAVERSMGAAPAATAAPVAQAAPADEPVRNAPTAEEAKANAEFIKQLMQNPESMGLTKEEAAQLGDLGQLLKDANDGVAAQTDPNARNTE